MDFDGETGVILILLFLFFFIITRTYVSVDAIYACVRVCSPRLITLRRVSRKRVHASGRSQRDGNTIDW